MDGKGNKRRQDNYHYYKRKKTSRYQLLEPGLKGFLCTCNGREKDCIRESYNILNEYADKLYCTEKSFVNFKDINSTQKDNEEIEDELQQEIATHNQNKLLDEKRFQVVDSGTKGCVFIKTLIEDPIHLAHEIMTDIKNTKQSKARYLLRMIPIEITCKAYLDDIKKAAEILFDKHFKCEPTTFSIVYNKRNNNNLLREEIIKSLAIIVTDKNCDHKADLKQAKFTILVEVMKNICCLAVIQDYFDLRKFNITELSKCPLEAGDTTIGNEQKELSDEDCVEPNKK
uniref:THUMP domain-containing protein n=1 Tax=Clastoptera arizonana TaxID=38151 RepID=A0A1B6CRM5_9HEMI